MFVIKFLLISIIKLYKLLISPFLGNNCRYLPTCSEYFIDCLNEYGVIKGSIKGLKRILSCHPIKFLGGGDGFDPAKKRSK
tara:strand:- start:3224 stop:3466 length:243 start_codon:yes stop_codon:yes gene_type:complete